MNSFVIEKTSVALSPVDMKDFRCTDIDVLLRLQSDNQCKTISVTSTQTQTITDVFNAYRIRYDRDVELLCSVIYWQKKTIDYQALYTAFLLNALSEEDFEQEAEKFTVHQKDVPPEKIASVVNQLDSLLELTFDTSDYADYFQCSQKNVIDGLRLLPQSHFSEMLPAVENHQSS
ncbi:MAG: hypothetical protein WAW61_13565 [Methylococcaceae bacterium]